MTDSNVVDLKLVQVQRGEEESAAAMREIVEEIKTARQMHWPSPPDGAPITLQEMVALAMHRYGVACNLIREAVRAKQSKAERAREKYTVPDPERPWDIAGRDGQTVSEFIGVRLEHVKLSLDANDPDAAAATLRFLAGHIENALAREERRQKRAQRAER